MNGQLIRRESRGTRDLAQLEVLWQAAASDAPSEASTPVALQSGLLGMNILVWQGNGWRTESTPVADGAQPEDPGGLQVGLLVPDREAPLIKFFLLGGT